MNNETEISMNGFWEDRKAILDGLDEDERPEFDDDFCEHGFEFMDATSSDIRDIPGYANDFSAYNFLHGHCNVFAQYLSKKYGYDVEAVYEVNRWDHNRKTLVHMYCTYEKDGKTVYVDIRGKCNDWDLFMKEFYDLGLWENDDDTVFGNYTEVPRRYRAKRSDKWIFAAAAVYDEKYGYYAKESASA